MPFRGLTMLKSRKLVIKGGLCYRFAMVPSCVASWRIQLLTFITVNQMINVMLLFVNTHYKKNPSR